MDEETETQGREVARPGTCSHLRRKGVCVCVCLMPSLMCFVDARKEEMAGFLDSSAFDLFTHWEKYV